MTKAELFDAYTKAEACIAEAGFSGAIGEASSGGYSMMISSSIDSSDGDVETTLDQCLATHVVPLDLIYRSANIPTGEERQRQYEEWLSCMGDAGMNTDGIELGWEQSATITRLQELNGEVPSWNSATDDCIEKYYAVLWPETLDG